MPSCTKPARSSARLLGDVVDLGESFKPVGQGGREEVVGEQRLRSAAPASPSMVGEQQDPDLEAPAEGSGAPCSFPHDYAGETIVGQGNYEQRVVAQVPVLLPPPAVLARTAEAGPLERLAKSWFFVNAL